MSHEIVPAHLAVKAMQDNGYKNAAYAIAELMDNSIQAGAKNVELLCAEEVEQLQERCRSRIKQLAVLDNGGGMEGETLRIALQFGNGKYLDYEKHTGIGRFGMGLPCSSISQAQRVEVWTWQAGVDSAIYSYLDVDEIKDRKYSEVPEPVLKAIPSIWLKAGQSFGVSGTLVVWSRMNRCIWRTARTVIDNSELLIGRIYRKFIYNNKVNIRLAAFDLNEPNQPSLDRTALPNDPLYLTAHTSCPPPFDNQSMFEQWGQDREFTVSYRNKLHRVVIRFAVATKEARDKENAGSLPHGKHAEKNIGVSIVRADRELDLDSGWAMKADTRERWWGVELDFPPSLDDLFGVTNNKQSAHNFSELAKIDIEDLLNKEEKTIHELIDDWTESDDPRGPLLEIALTIQKHIKILRNLIKEHARGTRTKKRHENTLVEETATQATEERKKAGHTGASDTHEGLPIGQRIDALISDLTKDGKELEEAKQAVAKIIDKGLKYEIVEADLETAAFFSVKQIAGVLKVSLNTTHPLYDKLVEVLEEDVEGVEASDLRDRLENARDGLKLLLTAWARYEDEQPDGDRRYRAQEARTDWGRVARTFFKDRQ
jgi:Histidine kinase-, DNA gyrase B-, and HSP90-like ATPase